MFTVFERNILSAMEDFSITIESSLQNSIEALKLKWLDEQVQVDYKSMFSSALKSLEDLHKPLQEITSSITPNLKDFSKKNYKKIEDQVKLLESKIEETIFKQNEEQINKWNRIISSVSPSGKPQERVLNVFYFINKYGFDFVHELCELDLSWDYAHQIIKI
jgi:uncharacterized protein YllA (UPF0747 family)